MQKKRRQISARKKTKSIKRQKAALLFGLIAAAAVLIVVCICLFAPVFDIKNIVCVGNSKISSNSIAEASGIAKGHNIFLTNFSSNEKNVEELEYIEKCNIKRVFPDTVKIIVTERQPAAYFAVGDALVVTDMSGIVVDLVNTIDAQEIVSTKISSEEEAEPSESPSPEEEEEDESTKDGTIWGYDDDGDPIYRINGGHYEFDDDGNRYFVNDTPTSTPEPTESPEPSIGQDYDELNRTSSGTLIYDAPIVYGVGITKYTTGDELESDDSQKLSSVFEALNALNKAGLLERTTKFEAENLNDIKFVVEDRLEVWFGTFFDFEYKARFAASVIDNNLSKYEHAIIDFRDSKLYVRSMESVEQILETSPDPNTNTDEDVENSTSTPAPTPSDDDEEESQNDESEEDERAASSTDSDEDSGQHTPTPRVGRE